MIVVVIALLTFFSFFQAIMEDYLKIEKIGEGWSYYYMSSSKLLKHIDTNVMLPKLWQVLALWK